MAKNYMADVAKILGVELDEEFKIKGCKSIYRLMETGLYLKYENNLDFKRASGLTLVSILQGRISIIKLNKGDDDNATD